MLGQALPPRPEIPQFSLSVAAEQGAGERVLGGVIEHDHPWTAGKLEPPGLAQWSGIPQEAGRVVAARLERHDARNLKQTAGVILELEVLERQRKEEYPELFLHRR